MTISGAVETARVVVESVMFSRMVVVVLELLVALQKLSGVGELLTLIVSAPVLAAASALASLMAAADVPLFFSVFVAVFASVVVVFCRSPDA